MNTVNLLMTFSLFAPVALLVAGQVATLRDRAFPTRLARVPVVAMHRFEARAAANDAELSRAA